MGRMKFRKPIVMVGKFSGEFCFHCWSFTEIQLWSRQGSTLENVERLYSDIASTLLPHVLCLSNVISQSMIFCEDQNRSFDLHSTCFTGKAIGTAWWGSTGAWLSGVACHGPRRTLAETAADGPRGSTRQGSLGNLTNESVPSGYD